MDLPRLKWLELHPDKPIIGWKYCKSKLRLIHLLTNIAWPTQPWMCSAHSLTLSCDLLSSVLKWKPGGLMGAGGLSAYRGWPWRPWADWELCCCPAQCHQKGSDCMSLAREENQIQNPKYDYLALLSHHQRVGDYKSRCLKLGADCTLVHPL